MNELYGYAHGSQRSAGTKRGRRTSRGSSMSRSRSRSAAHVLSGGSGHYQGKLRPPKKAKRPSKYDKAGYSQEVERYGSQSLADVCYLGATSYCKDDLGLVIGVALIRKLLKRHYMLEYTHPDQAVIPNSLGFPGPFRISFYYEYTDGLDAEPTIALGNTFDFVQATVPQTLRQFAVWFSETILSGPNYGGDRGSMDSYRIHGYQFSQIDYSSADPIRSATVHTLRNQYMTCYSAVKMGIQNVTPADGGSLLTTHVDTNPIKGKLMKFKDMLPLLQQRRGALGATSGDNAFKLQIDPNDDGIIKPNASLIGGWRQIPTASMFANCVGEVGVSLEPGAIKDYSLFFKYNGTLEKFIKGNRSYSPAPGFPNTRPFETTGAFGQSCLFMLEKRMPTGDSDVSINFHYESRQGCVFGKRLGMLMQRVLMALLRLLLHNPGICYVLQESQGPTMRVWLFDRQ